MRKVYLGLIILISAPCSSYHVNGAELPAENIAFTENCNNFTGSFASLPDGFSVSKNGSSAMNESDIDFRGITSNAVSTGGCYAWAVSSNDTAIGCQPTSDKFSPGWFMLTITNMTGRAVQNITVSYDAYCRNNEDRASVIYLEVAGDAMNFNCISSLTSDQTADTEPSWTKYHISSSTKLRESIPHSKRLFVRWSIDDAGGSGYRDELGIDNIKVIIRDPIGTCISIR